MIYPRPFDAEANDFEQRMQARSRQGPLPGTEQMLLAAIREIKQLRTRCDALEMDRSLSHQEPRE